MKIVKCFLFFILLSCSTNIKSFAGPKNWDEAMNYAPIQQKQFCDLTDSYVEDLAEAIVGRNEIKQNKIKQQRQEDLDGLIPEGRFKDWIVKTVSVKQVNDQKNKKVDGNAAVVFELWCGTQIGSGRFDVGGDLMWGATIQYDSRQYKEVSKLSSGEFAIISGTFQKLNDFAPGQKETYYASRALTNKDLEDIKNSRYGNGDELFLAAIKYIASAK